MGWFRKVEKVFRSFPGDRKVRTALHLRGKNLQSVFKALRPPEVSSARGYYSASSPYGVTGSIVGRY